MNATISVSTAFKIKINPNIYHLKTYGEKHCIACENDCESSVYMMAQHCKIHQKNNIITVKYDYAITLRLGVKKL